MKKLDVIIPVHNSAHWLSWCLEELFRHPSERLNKVFVVSDGSNQAQLKKIEEIVSRYEEIIFLNNKGPNGGFGYACNLGAFSSESDSELILFLNTDCLLTDGVIEKLCETFDFDSDIVLACPVSNNSPTLSYPMFPGRSYRDMALMISDSSRLSEECLIGEVCTVVGNCLVIRRNFYEQVGGFSSEWGLGYGEETDLHMKAEAMGLKGVVHEGCYVYHYGGGTFNFQNEIEQHRKKNHQLFLSKWASQYKKLATRCKVNPLDSISRRIDLIHLKKYPVIHLDVLFFLPGIDQGIGGIHAVIAICNELIRKGLRVSCALVGISADQGLREYKEPVLFNFLYFTSENEFLSNKTILPKIVISTIFYSASIVAEYAKRRQALPIQFIQGYEGYFENGAQYLAATESYSKTTYLITTSDWLLKKIERHLTPEQTIEKLQLNINRDIFFPNDGDRDIDVCLILRASPDKGQWLLIEILDNLLGKNLNITVLISKTYSSLKKKFNDKVHFIDLPLDQYSLSRTLQKTKVFIDASLHEGYGLLPLEAALCGCSVIASNSGGVEEYASNYDIELIKFGPDPEPFLQAIDLKIKNFDSKVRSTARHANQPLAKDWYVYINTKLEMLSGQKQNADVIFGQSFQAPNDNLMMSINKNNFHDFSIKVYRKFKRYIPYRMQLVAKLLILGHL
ncbi:glycosyltransferase [Polynucleobacter paneuropaeus]|nr:glycosyltransferase [Polynucleobacter paneuropaeus]